MTFHNISGDAAIMLHFLVATLDHIHFLKAFQVGSEEYHYHFAIALKKRRDDINHALVLFEYRTDKHSLKCSKFKEVFENVNTYQGVIDLKLKMIAVINKEVQNNPQKHFYDKDI